MNRRITMADVAKAANCSQATVSIVLNGVTDVKISPQTRARVLEAARHLGYGEKSIIRRPVLSGLKGGCIGVIADQLATAPEAVTIIEGIRQEAWNNDISVAVMPTLGRAEQEERALARLLRAGIEGLVVVSVFTRRISLLPRFYDLPFRTVLANCYTDDGAFPALVPDEVRGGQQATQCLLDAGHRRIGTIIGEPFMEAAQDRLTGYRQALLGEGLVFDDDLVAEGNWTPSSGYEATQRLLSLHERPTAIVCQNDRMALGCVNALNDAGLKVPGDVSVIGYDDDELCRHMRPQLSSVVLPHRTIGAEAVRQLAVSLPAEDGHFRKRGVRCSLVKRASITTMERQLSG